MIDHPKDAWERFLDEFYETFSVIGTTHYKIFICGSYVGKHFDNLKEIKSLISEESDNYLAFFESDFQKTYEENYIFKFDLLADFSNEIIMIIEHDRGGHILEMGIILAIREYLDKTYTFVLRDAPITLMLTRGGLLSPFFREGENLFYFNNIDDLRSKILEHLGFT